MSPEQQQDIEKIEAALRKLPRHEILAFASTVVEGVAPMLPPNDDAVCNARRSLAATRKTREPKRKH